MTKEKDTQSRVDSQRPLPSTGSTASSFWRYVRENINELISITFSVVLAMNVIFWFSHIFGFAVRSWSAALGYMVGVAIINQIHRAVISTMRGQSQSLAYKFNNATMTWAIADSAHTSESVLAPSAARPKEPELK